MTNTPAECSTSSVDAMANNVRLRFKQGFSFFAVSYGIFYLELESEDRSENGKSVGLFLNGQITIKPRFCTAS